jgi:hypothetical protein
VVRYVEAMKAVDPDIEIGAVLGTPPNDSNWSVTWNQDVLRECGELIDFGIIHWYPNDPDFISAPGDTIHKTFETLQATFDEYAGDNADDIGVAVTEIGPAPGHPPEHRQISGIFAADSYLTYIEFGAFNIDWLELHNGTFLSERDDLRGPAFHGIHAANIVAAAGERLVRADSDSPSVVRVHAGRGKDGEVRLMLINRGRRRAAEVTIEGIDGANRAQLYRYDPYGAENGTSNELEGPEEIELDGPLMLPWRTLAVLVFDED